jgi:hypothetical protein
MLKSALATYNNLPTYDALHNKKRMQFSYFIIMALV